MFRVIKRVIILFGLRPAVVRVMELPIAQKFLGLMFKDEFYWRSTHQQIQKCLSRSDYEKTLDLLAQAAQRSLSYAGLGRLMHNVLRKVPDLTLRQKYVDDLKEKIISRFDENFLLSTRSDENYLQNYLFLSIVTGERDRALEILRTRLVHLNGFERFRLLRFMYPASVEAGAYDIVFSYLEEAAKKQDSLTKVRAASVKAFRGVLHAVQAQGEHEDRTAPLINPAPFTRFKEKAALGRTLLEDVPRQAREWIIGQQIEVRSAGKPVRKGPTRILIVADNWNFMRIPVELLERAGFVVRFLPFDQVLRAIDGAHNINGSAPKASDFLYTFGPFSLSPSEARAALKDTMPTADELIEWCDIVFVEWWSRAAIWFSRYLDPAKSLIVRCHSYEAFSPWPYFSNFLRVDGAIFIADHIKNIFKAVFADLPFDAISTAVVPNLRDLKPFTYVAKEPDARYCLGLMQYATANKDPIFALDILDELRRVDPRWTLRLVGHGWKESDSLLEKEYSRAFDERLRDFPEGVYLDQFTRDTAEWFKKIGFILSTSHREGSHESVVEGMAAGAVPVLRRWPMVKDFGAPETVFPDIPSFDTAKGAAAYILQVSDNYDEASSKARHYAMSHYDVRVTGPAFVDFISQCHRAQSQSAADNDHH